MPPSYVLLKIYGEKKQTFYQCEIKLQTKIQITQHSL